MRIAKTIIVTVLSVSLLVSCIFTATTTYKINRAGNFSSVCYVSEKGRQFIIEKFGHITDIDELINEVEKYVIENFEYNNNYKTRLLQSFDFDEFLFEGKGKNGVCFELSCFMKTVLTQVFSYQNKKDVKVFVLDVRLPSDKIIKPAHSYNYIIEENRIVAFDMVASLNGNKWRKTIDGNSISDIYACARSMDESPYNIY